MNEELQTLNEKLLYYFENRKFADLRMTLLDTEPADIAGFMESELNETERLIFFRLLPKELASDVFVEFDSDTQEELIKAFTDTELKAVINDMFMDDAVDVIEEMPANVVKRILKNSDPENRKQINELLEYPEDSAGSIMTTEFISLSAKMTIEAAFDKIRKTGVNKETIYTCYVTDDKKHLIGVVTVKDMLLADVTETIENVMDTNLVTVETLEDKEQVAMKLSKYDFLALPVVDKEGCIVGIVTVDDAVDVLQEEATEDIQKMAAMLPTEKPYLKQSVWSIWKARIPWLLLLMVSATFTSLILSKYESSLAALSTGAVLYSFVPMLMDTAGNAGSQSSVTIVRALALGDVEFKDIFKVIWKELRAAMMLGLAVSAVCFAKLMLVDRLYNDVTWAVAGIVSGVLFVTIVLAKFVGCVLPLVAKKCKLDPAVVASPFITTIVDALSLIIYCSAAIALLS
ncbi:MAG TPA: magnesium transporter [Clostridiales bacterium]|nr:magnesium transporter [Clostridiales bacterium]